MFNLPRLTYQSTVQFSFTAAGCGAAAAASASQVVFTPLAYQFPRN